MKKVIQILVVTLLFSTVINAQSTERFIRIIGNSKEEIKANKVKVYFSISGLTGNEYKKIDSKEYEDVYNEVISKFSDVGINENDIKSIFKKFNRYDKVKSKNFFIEANIEDLEKITSINTAGFIVSVIKYLFSEIDNDLEIKLSLKAIQDAKRKAKIICERIDMKLGEILNIEVKSGDISRSTKENNERLINKTYKVSITFKLIDG